MRDRTPASHRPDRPPTLLGWREWITLPDLGIDRIKAKLDTGARTSALHAEGVETFRDRGETWVRFRVRPSQADDSEALEVEAPLLEKRAIRSSNGRVEKRPVILTSAFVAGRTFDLELTLTDRSAMGFRMLLGREALAGRFLVDAGRSYRAGADEYD